MQSTSIISHRELAYTQKLVQQYLAYRNTILAEGDKKTEFSKEDAGKELQGLLEQQEDSPSTTFSWFAFDDSIDHTDQPVMIGVFRCDYPKTVYEFTPPYIRFDGHVLPMYCKKGIATTVFQQIIEYLKQEQDIDYFTHIRCVAKTDEGKGFLTKMGGEDFLKGIDKVARFDEINWKLVNQWAKPESEQPEFITFVSCPEELLEPYTKLYTELKKESAATTISGMKVETQETRRTREKNFKEKFDITWLNAVVREKDGSLSAMTEVLLNIFKENPNEVVQGLSGVSKGCRGRGLGKYTKARMLQFLKKEYPYLESIGMVNWEYQEKTNAQKAMERINQKLGYKTLEEYFHYRFPIQYLM